MPEERITVFGELKIHTPEGIRSPQLLSTKKLIALLLKNPSQNWQRSEIAEAIWGISDEQTNRNRLRTTLSQARIILAEYLEIASDKNSIWLGKVDLEVDLWVAQSLFRRSKIPVDDDQELSILADLIKIINAPFLPECSSSWAEVERSKWQTILRNSTLRSAEMYEARSEFFQAISTIESILKAAPYDEQIWAALLRVNAKIGRHVEIHQKFETAKNKLRKELDAKFSQNLLNLAQSVRFGLIPSASLKPAQSDIASRVLGRMLEQHPEEALMFLGSQAFRPEIFNHTSLTIDLLEKSLTTTQGYQPARLKCITYLLIGYGIQNKQNEIRKWAPIILENDLDHNHLRGAANALAFSYFQIRDWDSAYKFGNFALEKAKSLDDKIGVSLAQAQLAAFDWHNKKYDSAIEVYRNSFSQLTNPTEIRAQHGQATIAVNLGLVFTFLNQPQNAIEWLQRGINIAKVFQFSSLLAIANPALGATLIAIGNVNQGKKALADGLSIAFRQKDERTIQIALDYAAYALATLGSGAKAISVLNWVTQLRKRDNHPRSQAEEDFECHILSIAKHDSPDIAWWQTKGHRKRGVTLIDEFTKE